MAGLRRIGRCIGWGLAAAAMAAAAGMLAGDIRAGIGRLGLGLVRGQVEVAWASDPIQAMGPVWAFGSGSRVNVGPLLKFMPTSMDVQIGTGLPGGGVILHRLRACYVPLPLAAAVLGAGAVLVLRLTRWKPGPGACGGCGYDVAGLPVCPECGRGSSSPAP